MPFLVVIFQAIQNILFSSFMPGVANHQRPTATFPIVLPQRATSYTWAQFGGGHGRRGPSLY